MNDPTRLRDDPNVTKPLREALEATANEPASHFDVDSALARFDTAVATAATPWIAKPWLIGGAIGTALVVVGVLSLPTADAPPPTPPSPVAVPTPGIAASTPTVGVMASAPSLVEAAPLVPVLEPSAAKQPQRAPDRGVVGRAAEAVELDADARLREEIANLALARESLNDAPTQALRHAERGEQRFGEGMFSQERRAIIALSSLRLRRANAHALATRFLETYPHGPLSERVRAELDSSAQEP